MNTNVSEKIQMYFLIFKHVSNNRLQPVLQRYKSLHASMKGLIIIQDVVISTGLCVHWRDEITHLETIYLMITGFFFLRISFVWIVQSTFFPKTSLFCLFHFLELFIKAFLLFYPLFSRRCRQRRTSWRSWPKTWQEVKLVSEERRRPPSPSQTTTTTPPNSLIHWWEEKN